MKTTTHAAAVIPLHLNLVAPAAEPAHMPKVFTPHFIERLGALNDALRWLRGNGHSPVTVHLQDRLPTIQVDAKAAPLLIGEGCGYNAHFLDAGHRHCNVIFKGCSICWVERAKLATN